MKSTPVGSIVEFVKVVEQLTSLTGTALFRGQAVQGNLIPSIARKNPGLDSSDLEKRVIRQLELRGSSLIGDGHSSQLGLLVLAAHFGLKTRLLDWTSNPFSALWFACADKEPGDAFVYFFDAGDFLVEDAYEGDPFTASKTRAFQPRLNNARILAQSGWFTLHRYSKKAKRFVSLEKNLDSRDKIEEIRIPESQRSTVLDHLDRYGVTAKSTFPDLQGLCEFLNWRFKL